MDDFFKIIDANNRDAAGNLIDPGLLDRLNHPYCQTCIAEYRTKFPDTPFQIACHGIYSEEEIAQRAIDVDEPEEEIRECLDPVYWAEKHYKTPDAEGNYVPFIAREYQKPILRCTAQRKIDRLARGLGKTSMGVIEELHIAFQRKNFSATIATPQEHQKQMWYDEILRTLNDDVDLRGSLVSKKQKPYGEFQLSNGSTIRIFTAGSKSGRGGGGIRGQNHTRRVRLDEQDYLSPQDWGAIGPLLHRFPDSSFHGSSTPTGAHEKYYEMCTSDPTIKEFYLPISVHPNWGPEMEAACRREARTDAMYDHEYLALFGTKEAGVYKSQYVDAAVRDYKYAEEKYNPYLHYFLGVDWNGMGTGTRIRVLSYDVATTVRRVVDHLKINSTITESITAIRDINRKWHCDKVAIDAGMGAMQAEILRKMGADSPMHPDDHKLKDILVVDFGATLTFNRLVPKRDDINRVTGEDAMEVERRTKPFMVEGSVMCLEGGQFEFARTDKILDEQFRAYVVKTWSAHGYANTYDSGGVGDHDLDATLLALLAIELKYGIYYKPHKSNTAGSIRHLAGFGPSGAVRAGDPEFDSVREVQKSEAGIPSRTISPNREAYLASMLNNGSRGKGALTAPNMAKSSVRSRVGIFHNANARTGHFGGNNPRRPM